MILSSLHVILNYVWLRGFSDSDMGLMWIFRRLITMDFVVSIRSLCNANLVFIQNGEIFIQLDELDKLDRITMHE